MTRDHHDRPEPDQDRERMAPRAASYAALPDKTREFIENLRDRDLERLQDAIRLAESLATMGRLTRWVLLTAAGLATAITGLVTAWNQFRGNSSPGGHP